MAPKRKAAPKTKVAAEPETLPDLSGITIRRTLKNDDTKKDEESELSIENLNSTVLIEKMKDFSNPAEIIESDNSGNQLMEEEPKKISVKKTAIKGKSKLSKDVKEDVRILRGRTRASSVDRQPIFTALEKKTVGKSRKRRVDKDISPDASDMSKPIVTNKVTKRNRRAASVDILSTEISKTSEDTIVTKDRQQTNKKNVVKEIESKSPDTSEHKEFDNKSKKKIKKNDEKKQLLTQENNANSHDALPQETKPKRNAKKDQIDKQEQNNKELTTKKTGRNRKAPKVKQIDDLEKELILQKQNSPTEEAIRNNNSDDSEILLDSPEQNCLEPITKKSGKTQKASKVKQIDEVNRELIIKKQKSPPKEELILKKQKSPPKEELIIKKQKSPPKEELILKKPNSSPNEESIKNINSGDSDVILETPEIKPKKGVKKVKTNGEQKDALDKPKISKRGRKNKNEISEEPLNCTPPNDNDVEDKTDIILPDTPESDKTDIKPMVKRKTKAKLAKK